MSLANKYRPQTFDTVIAQSHITDILKEQCKQQDKAHHNYIFFGLRGTGKTSAARILAKALNCKNLKDGNPCNECENCKIIDEGKTLDYVEIDAASHTGVDNIREEILEKAIYPPSLLKKKIYIIDEVHMLSKGAFNALLKTIEEPKDNVCFILATTEIHKIPDTILSRCQVFNFRKVDDITMIQHLENIAEQEGLNYENNALELISKISEGSVRDAVKYVDQISILGNLSEENASKFLGIASEGILKDFITLVKEKNSEKVFAEIEQIHHRGIDLNQFAKQLIIYLDKHLLEDIDFSLALSESISEIMSKIRYYPYPAVIYKIVLHKFMNGETIASTSNSPSLEKKDNTKNKENTENKQNIEKKENTENTKNIETGKNTLREQFLEKAGDESFSTILKKYCKLENTETTLIITTINKMAELSLKKEDTIKKIAGFLAELGENKTVEIKFQNKEDFLKAGLL